MEEKEISGENVSKSRKKLPIRLVHWRGKNKWGEGGGEEI